MISTVIKLKYKPLHVSEDAAEACLSKDKTNELESGEGRQQFCWN